jgi:hypothetical protein
MSTLELLRAEDPAIAAEARYLELQRKYSQVRRIGGPHNHTERPVTPAYAVLAPFVGAAVRHHERS